MTRKAAALVDFMVPGPPHSQKPWVSRAIDAALGQPRVTEPCDLEVEFALTPDHVPWILPSETSLSNMLRVLLEALEETVLRGAQEEGGGLVSIRARSKVVNSAESAGTHVVVRRANPRR